jgi:hypothetical protein
MRSYHVQCGTLDEQVRAENPDAAARQALEQNDAKPDPTRLSFGFEVRPKGRATLVRLTERVLRDCGRLVEQGAGDV